MSPAEQADAQTAPGTGNLARARLAVAAAGVGAAAAQVLVIRELLVASAGNELSIAVVLSAWLLWSAAGAWFGGRVVGRSKRPPVFHVTVLAVAEVAALPLALALSRDALYLLRELSGEALVRWHLVPPPGGTLSLPQLLLLTTLVTAPACVLLGWQFAAGCALLERTAAGKRGPALAYLLDSTGHLAGGAILSLAVVTRIPAEWTLLAACTVVLAGVWLLQPLAWRVLLAAALVAAVALGAPSFRGHTLGLRWAPYHLVASTDGPVGNVAVLGGEGGELAYFANGSHAFETGKALAGEQWVDLPLLAHPNPKQILLIGGGPRTLRQALAHRPERITYFELDATIIRAVRDRAPEPLRAVLDDPRVVISVGDARLHLPELLRTGQRFDVVLVALGDPTTAQLNRYYTLKWFRQVRRLLTPDGLVALQVMSSADYLSPELRSYNACVFHTAERAGLQVTVFPGPRMTMVASTTPGATDILADLPALRTRMRSRGLDPATVLASFYDALDPARREDRQRDLEQTTGVSLNDDFTPTCYYYAQVLWASWWRGATPALLRQAQRLRLWHVLAAIALGTTLLLGWTRLAKAPSRVAAPCALLVAGAGGMTLEVVLLLGLQSLYGYVYGMVGYAVGMLMAGLALGAWLAQRSPSGRPHLALAAAQAGLVLAAALAAGGLILLRFVAAVWPGAGLLAVVLISLLMVATGLTVGAAFPTALTLVGDAHVRRATALYATDLLGACGGALLSGLILVPLLGIVGTCGAVAALAAGSALLCILSLAKEERA